MRTSKIFILVLLILSLSNCLNKKEYPKNVVLKIGPSNYGKEFTISNRDSLVNNLQFVPKNNFSEVSLYIENKHSLKIQYIERNDCIVIHKRDTIETFKDVKCGKKRIEQAIIKFYHNYENYVIDY